MAINISNSIDIEVAKTALANVYKELFEKEYPLLFNAAYEKIQDSEASKEILRECFTSILEAAYKMFNPEEVKGMFIEKLNETCQSYLDEIEAKREYALQHDQLFDFDNTADEEITKAALEALNKLPEERKRILLQTLQKGATIRMVADNNNMDKEKVEAYNWYTVQILRRLFFGK